MQFSIVLSVFMVAIGVIARPVAEPSTFKLPSRSDSNDLSCIRTRMTYHFIQAYDVVLAKSFQDGTLAVRSKDKIKRDVEDVDLSRC